MSENEDKTSAEEQTPETASVANDEKGAFTIKSVFFGLLGLAIVICYTAYNDFYLKQTSFVANHLPPGPIFLVLALALIWNPMWCHRKVFYLVNGIIAVGIACFQTLVAEQSFWLSWHWIPVLFCIAASSQSLWQNVASKCVMRSKELIVTLIFIFVGCWTAGAGLNYFFTPTQIFSWTQYNNSIQMQKYETIHYVPAHLWPSGGLDASDAEEKQRVFDAYTTGYEAQGTEGIPWDAWMPSLLSSWIPMLVLFSACLIAMSLIVHRQWSQHEQLAYPIAHIGNSLFERTHNRALPDLFYNKLFWVAALCVICFHGIRYLHVWWPNQFPDIVTSTRFDFMWNLFPVLNKSGGFWVNHFSFFFSIVGICYFLSREIGLSLGISQFALAILGAQIYISTGQKLGSEDHSNMRAGAYIAYAAIILYTGRVYYLSVLKKAFTFKPADEHEENGVFAARILVISFLGLIMLLCLNFGLDIYVATFYMLLSMLLFLVFSRIVCETGLPYMQAGWQPGLVISKLFGVSAIGAAPMVIMYYFGAILFSDPKEAMIPYVANSLKMAEQRKVKLKRLCGIIIGVVLAAIFVSMTFRIYQMYTMGSNAYSYAYGDFHVPKNFLGASTRDLTQLDDLGQRTAPGEAESRSIFERASVISPDGRTLGYITFGAVCVGLFFFMRFRFTGFPLHPVLFLVWGTYPSGRTFYAFLIGWFIRELVVRFGGGKLYQDYKPFFIGLIFGELFMGMFGVTTGLLYHVFTDFEELPPRFKVIVG